MPFLPSLPSIPYLTQTAQAKNLDDELLSLRKTGEATHNFRKPLCIPNTPTNPQLLQSLMPKSLSIVSARLPTTRPLTLSASRRSR